MAIPIWTGQSGRADNIQVLFRYFLGVLAGTFQVLLRGTTGSRYLAQVVQVHYAILSYFSGTFQGYYWQQVPGTGSTGTAALAPSWQVIINKKSNLLI